MAKKKTPEFFDRELPVVLTVEEKAQKGFELAKLIKCRIDRVEDKRQFLADMRDKLLRLDEKIADTETIVRTGKEQRKVRCRREMDYEANKVHIFRTDTGDVVESRAMKSSERQMELGADDNASEVA